MAAGEVRSQARRLEKAGAGHPSAAGQGGAVHLAADQPAEGHGILIGAGGTFRRNGAEAPPGRREAGAAGSRGDPCRRTGRDGK